MALLIAWCAAAAILLLTGPPGLTRLDQGEPRDVGRLGAPLRIRMIEPVPRTCLCVLSGASLGWWVAGGLTAAAGAVGGVGLSWWISRLEPAAVVRAREAIRRDLPVAMDLLAACSSVGHPPQRVLPIVSAAVGGPLGARLAEVSARLSLGADPAVEWGRLATDPELGALGRAVGRSLVSGAPLADNLTRLAEDRRRDRRTETQMRARSVGVRAAGPLAACFLPAFMLIGVVPTVAGSFHHLFG